MQIVSHYPSTSLPDDTPPLSRSRSPSADSATRSTPASSPNLAIGELGTKMSNTMLEGPMASEWNSQAESGSKSANHSRPDGNLQPLHATDDIEEEDINGSSTEKDVWDWKTQRGRPGYPDRSERLQAMDHPRPIMERQSSYSKRHSSFNTRRETPYPQGYLGSHLTPHQVTTKGSQSHTLTVPFPSDLSSSSSTSASLDTTPHVPIPNVSRPQQEDSSDIERMSSHSLPIPDSVPFSALPTVVSHGQDSSARYTNPRPAPLPPTLSSKPSSEAVPSRSTLASNPHIPSRLSPSPPLLADEDVDMNAPPYAPLTYPNRLSEPLPPRLAPQHAGVPSRPTSLPHTLTGSFSRSSFHGCPNIPPPQPPTILTPPPPLSVGGNRKPAPHEPFLPHRQPSSDHTYIAVETLNTEYILVVRLPGFQRDAITLAARRRRVLHVVADDWNENGGHFERRITFGYDADLYNVRAEFDGEFLRIHVPRKILPVGYGRPVPTQ